MHTLHRAASLALLMVFAGSAHAGIIPWNIGGNAVGTGSSVLGTVDNHPLYLMAGSTFGLILEAASVEVGGVVYSGVQVFGGEAALNHNATGVPGTTVMGGMLANATNYGNIAHDLGCTVSGGSLNFAGRAGLDIADGRFAVISGGFSNVASGEFSVVPGGSNNIAGGKNSFAGGTYALVGLPDVTYPNGHEGSFVWSDATGTALNQMSTTAPNQFLVRATGGMGINTTSPRGGMEVAYDSNSSRPQLTLTEVGADFARVNFRNTATTRFFSMASFSAGVTAAADRLNFYHNTGGNLITCTGDGKVGIGTANPGAFKLDVNDSVRCTSLTQTSSGRYKSNVAPVSNILERFSQLRPVAFTWDAEHGGERDLGLIAEEVGALFPEAVVTNSEGQTEGINYSRLTALAVQALRETREITTNQLRAHNESIGALRTENATLRTLTLELAARLEKIESRGR